MQRIKQDNLTALVVSRCRAFLGHVGAGTTVGECEAPPPVNSSFSWRITREQRMFQKPDLISRRLNTRVGLDAKRGLAVE